MTSTQDAIQNLLALREKFSDKENIKPSSQTKVTHPRLVAFDLVTQFGTKTEISEIGAVELIDNEFTGLQFHNHVRSENKRFVLKNFHNFAYHSLLVSHNIDFNFKLLKDELKSVGVKAKFKTFCTMVICDLSRKNANKNKKAFRQKNPYIGYDLQTVSKFFGLEKPATTPAVLQNAIHCARIYLQLATPAMLERPIYSSPRSSPRLSPMNPPKSSPKSSPKDSSKKHKEKKRKHTQTSNEHPKLKKKKVKAVLQLVSSQQEKFDSLTETDKQKIVHFMQTSSLEQLKQLFNAQKGRIVFSLRPFTDFDNLVEKFEKIPCLGARNLLSAVSKL